MEILLKKNISDQIVAMVQSVFVARTQPLPCDISNFVCPRGKWQHFQLFINNYKLRKLYSECVK